MQRMLVKGCREIDGLTDASAKRKRIESTASKERRNTKRLKTEDSEWMKGPGGRRSSVDGLLYGVVCWVETFQPCGFTCHCC